jgi:hypothetical protein
MGALRPRASPLARRVGRQAGPLGVLDAAEWPLRGDPVADAAPQRNVQVGATGPHPREHARVVLAVPNRIDVDAADDVPARAVEHGVGEARALSEVVGMALEVAAVLVQGHRSRPRAVVPAGVAWMCSFEDVQAS